MFYTFLLSFLIFNVFYFEVYSVCLVQYKNSFSLHVGLKCTIIAAAVKYNINHSCLSDVGNIAT